VHLLGSAQYSEKFDDGSINMAHSNKPKKKKKKVVRAPMN
jgi:hypothetical protein